MGIGLWPTWPCAQFLFLGLGLRDQITTLLGTGTLHGGGRGLRGHIGPPQQAQTPPHPTPEEPDHPSAVGPLGGRGLDLHSSLPTPRCGSHGVKNTQDQNSLSSQGNMRFLISSGAAAHDPAGDPRPLPGSPAPSPCSHALDCFCHLPIC